MEKLLKIVVGDVVRDCDPRSRQDKTVVNVSSTHVLVKGATVSRIARSRIHSDAKKRSGYLLLVRE